MALGRFVGVYDIKLHKKFLPDFRFCSNKDVPLWALQQKHGGPCGVFAPVQAYMIAHMKGNTNASLTLEDRDNLLANVLAEILLQTTETTNDKIWFVDAAQVTPYSSEMSPFEIPRSELVASVLEFNVHGNRGVLSFVYSVMLTRGLSRLQNDMDDPENSLVSGQFGHGTQELINLMLTGRATSNVFDGIVPMGDSGLVLRGVNARPTVGYLTHLEALRYCTVGSFYKTPLAPVWVIGSSSHFTVLFTDDMTLCEESKSDALFAQVQRAFKNYDTMESGFIPIDSLSSCLKDLHVASGILENQYQMGRLYSKMEVSGAGIVLWEDFWRVVSILLETNDIQQAIDGKIKETSRKRSDSDIARELQAQFDNETNGNSREIPSRTIPLISKTLDDEEEFIKTVDFTHYNGLIDKNNNLPGIIHFTGKIPWKNRVGYSIPLNNTSENGGHGNPIEDVLKTKWNQIEIKWNDLKRPKLD